MRIRVFTTHFSFSPLSLHSPHPGYPSSYETGLFQDWGCVPSGGTSSPSPVNLFIADDFGWELNTGQLVVAANASVSEASTVGGQSLSVGVPHSYTNPSFSDVFTAAGLIPASPTAALLVQTLNGAFLARLARQSSGLRAPSGLVSVFWHTAGTFRSNEFAVPLSDMAEAGVPTNGTANIAARLTALATTLLTLVE